MLSDFTNKIKNWTDIAVGDWGLIAIVFLIGFASFGLGRLSVLESVRAPVSITNAPTIAEPRGMNIGGLIVASRTGSAYHFPWCASAAKIIPQNQIWFASEEKARAAGYSPAKNCKGLQ
ncbi:MAG: Ada metal-binding domain-containing protein [bacterium]|nr:Ada metal-binding domain-containing protein [bacterium]